MAGNGGFLQLFSAKIPGDIEEPAQKQYFNQ
jgi:hypothetical protein